MGNDCVLSELLTGNMRAKGGKEMEEDSNVSMCASVRKEHQNHTKTKKNAGGSWWCLRECDGIKFHNYHTNEE